SGGRVGEVAAGHRRAPRPLATGGLDAREIVAAGRAAALDDASGHLRHAGMDVHGDLLQGLQYRCREPGPSRTMRTGISASGPGRSARESTSRLAGPENSRQTRRAPRSTGAVRVMRGSVAPGAEIGRAHV